MKRKWYIKERHNPQFKKPYFVAMGRLYKIDARACENPLYGNNIMHPYDTEEEYRQACNEYRIPVK